MRQITVEDDEYSLLLAIKKYKHYFGVPALLDSRFDGSYIQFPDKENRQRKRLSLDGPQAIQRFCRVVAESEAAKDFGWESDDLAEPSHVEEADEILLEDLGVTRDARTISDQEIWTEVMDTLPKEVERVSFSVNVEMVSPERQKDLEDQFPGVAIVHTTSSSRDLSEYDPIEVGKPKGIKRAVLEFDDDGFSKDPALWEKLQKRFPWATLQRPLENLSSVDHTTRDPLITTSAEDKMSTNGFIPNVEKDVVGPNDGVPQLYAIPTDNTAIGPEYGLVAKHRAIGALMFQAQNLNTGADNNDPDNLTDIGSRTSATRTREVIEIARKLNLHLELPEFTQTMYDEWLQTGQIPYHRSRKMKVAAYYSALTDLCIIAQEKNDEALHYEIFLRFQRTNYEYVGRNTFPPTQIALKAFQYLHAGSPLRQWIRILFAFLWDTERNNRDDEEGWDTFEEFKASFDNPDYEALAKFLFDVAQTRCPWTKGHDIKVLGYWCKYHKHEMGGTVEKECIEERDTFSKMSLIRMIEEQDALELDQAKMLIRNNGGTVHFNVGKCDTDTPPNLKKRKETTTPTSETHTLKAAKKSSGRQFK
ncbi:hypothetical protein CC78DRAFT_216465 [Lojkania enalia]|uniref:Uncharacterized protein n=1 Tax=Lojkania enalia TaxID=147567 RepID=A0A9P4KAP5_9PLEO|nr:hypothetical protein CC78DRAFT_216465 [Didymosphaeria enalia]